MTESDEYDECWGGTSYQWAYSVWAGDLPGDALTEILFRPSGNVVRCAP